MASHNGNGKAPANGRNPDGTFAKGHAGGPGRPPRQTEQAYLRTLAATITQDDWRAIVQTAIADAKAGDARARQWLSDWLLRGVPTLLDLAAADELEVDAVSDRVEDLRMARLLSGTARLLGLGEDDR